LDALKPGAVVFITGEAARAKLRLSFAGAMLAHDDRPAGGKCNAQNGIWRSYLPFREVDNADRMSACGESQSHT
jgi:hypothetical protein